MSFFDDFVSKSLLDNELDNPYKPMKENSSKLDIFDELNLLHTLLSEEDDVPSAPCNSPIDTEDFYQNNIYVTRISTKRNIINYDQEEEGYKGDAKNEQLFKKPPKTSKDAYFIWKQAGLPRYASYAFIESQLYIWALEYATLECDSDPNIWTITWKNTSGVTFTSKLTTFTKWMICACSRQSQV